jgi:hypothetical protein
MSEDESSAFTNHPALTERATRRTAPLARADFAFEERIDGTEAGVEPGTSCSDAIEAVFERGESVALALDTGTYRIETPIVLEEARSVGLLAKPGAEVSLEVPAGYDRALLSIREVEHALLAGIDIDQRASGAHPKVGITARESFLIEDVEIRGVGDSADSGSRMPLRVEREDGIGVLRGVRAAEGSAFPADRAAESRRPATWVGPESRGTIYFEDCHFEEHNAHAIYAAAAPGPVKILRGVYRNNDNSQIRFCGPECEVDGALIELDTEKCSHADHEDYRQTRGIFNEQKKVPRTGGCVRDTTIRVASHRDPVGGYVAYGTGGGMTIEGCEFAIDCEECPAITADAPGEHWGHPPAPEPRAIEVLDSRVWGTARSGTAIRIAGRPGSRVERCCIAGRGDRCGVDVDAGAVREMTFDLEAEDVVDAAEVDAIRRGSCADFFEDRRSTGDQPPDSNEEDGGDRSVLRALIERFDLD